MLAYISLAAAFRLEMWSLYRLSVLSNLSFSEAKTDIMSLWEACVTGKRLCQDI